MIGYVARKALKWAKQNQYVEHTSFLGYGVGLAFLTLGFVSLGSIKSACHPPDQLLNLSSRFVGMVGGDDILCCFIA